MPFLEIVTRHLYSRPRMLARQQASLAALEDSDWTQTLLVDDVGRGIGWSHENLAAYAPHLVGDYIWLLDDDDLCIYPALVGDLKAIVAQHDPDVVFIRMDHGPLGILPDVAWGCVPQPGDIGISAYVVRRAVWQRHAPAMCPGHYASDYDLIHSILLDGPRVVWHDVIASRVQRISQGRPE